MNPKISVLVPIYNVESYIKRCVNSVLRQCFTDWELILVDDGSPDDSPTICDEYAKNDARISVIHKKNGGLPSALTERPAAVQQQSTEEMSSRMVDTVLQRVLPAIAQQNSGSDADSMRPLYVGTLIADDTGIRELNKRMQVIEAKETRRR